ncbi:Hypothetical protein RG1141_CH26420 [Neorhizobium galegae bv. officinalis bv. officinalis str. HAMBI 1141]|uniref:Uncharacterized protein n=1 Tax=Neorhizobium galegae bv. officinalis bv. officinalis str. HAMBI 1141 TaxID=1028801 RepID=A0A068TA53_NEOGA|nr:Hypothetical protein RG1141_CH26420 [Neorhizobium galegae bv. officinalis bv. officinalis str. HAMBI 1141]
MVNRTMNIFSSRKPDMYAETRRRGTLPMISPLEGEMSPKVTEGGSDLTARQTASVAFRATPLCPAGHLPLKGGDRHAATVGGPR